MSHFLEISQFSLSQANQLLHRARQFKQDKQFPCYSDHRMANLFYENSTRTRVSFELAAVNLQIPVVNLDLQASSEAKGESITDTIANLAAMGIDVFVMRHQQIGLQQQLANTFANQNVHIINAGDGTHAHPSQAMLDMMTILEHKPHCPDIKIAIVGNLLHSRVANSLQALCKLMEVRELALVAPDKWLPTEVIYGTPTTSLREGLANADVVISLRVQRERMLAEEGIDNITYHETYGLTHETICYAKDSVMVMHPGPINRGVEIDSSLADCAQSYILRQVENGVYMRMAIIESLLGHL